MGLWATRAGWLPVVAIWLLKVENVAKVFPFRRSRAKCGWLQVGCVEVESGSDRKRQLVSCVQRSILFMLAAFAGSVWCRSFHLHVPLFARTQFAARSCMRASDSSRGMRAENCCVASRASMLVSACRYLPRTNAKLIAAYSSVV